MGSGGVGREECQGNGGLGVDEGTVTGEGGGMAGMLEGESTTLRVLTPREATGSARATAGFLRKLGKGRGRERRISSARLF